MCTRVSNVQMHNSTLIRSTRRLSGIRPTRRLSGFTVPNGPVVVNIPTLGMSLSHGNPLRRLIPHGERIAMANSGVPACRERPSQAWTGLPDLGPVSQPAPKIQRSGTGLSPHGTGLSPRRRARDRSRLPRTGCLASCRNIELRGPVSHIRDRSPRVKTLRTSQNSRDRTFRPEYHLRPSTKCGKVRSTHQTLEPRNLQRSSVLHLPSCKPFVYVSASALLV
uniref:Uncharacterized protein n=1 Tax=Ananas comosus var. bracteatus TaxID=296719 RepID=A0A6V7NTC9_ANACO|nr:unnamed protein product [Ananas comosus var. bracteatus]